MNKSVLALAVLGAFAGVASAQSSVTISGNIDLGVVRNGPKDLYEIKTSGSARSNLTFSGVEDLGGGMRAFFYLQHRFTPDDGGINNGQPSPGPTGNPYFWRQDWVGLGGNFGEVRLGRMLTPTQQFNGDYEAWGTNTVGSVHTGGSTRIVRAAKAVYYKSPKLGGLQVHAMAAEGDGQYPAAARAAAAAAAGTKGSRVYGLGVQYAAGPLSLAAGVDRDDIDLKTAGIYGSYDFGVAKLLAQYEKIDKTANSDYKLFSVSTTVPLGPVIAKAGVLNTKNSANDASQNKLGLGLDYPLSKRTLIYADMGKLSGDNLATNRSLTSMEKKASFDLGISHAF